MDILAFVFSGAGILLILRLPPRLLAHSLGQLGRRLFQAPGRDLAGRIRLARQDGPPGGLRGLAAQARETLSLTGKAGAFRRLCALCLLLFAAGAAFSLAPGSPPLLPLLAAGLPLVPSCYVGHLSRGYRKALVQELETALSAVTASYLRPGATFLGAVEENLPYLRPPAAAAFRKFALQTDLVSSDTREALRRLRSGIRHPVFHEWVDTLILCMDDAEKKAALPAIIEKLSYLRTAQGELDLTLRGPSQEYLCLALFLIALLPLCCLLHSGWRALIAGTLLGKALAALVASAVLATAARVAGYRRPLL
ncbi:MAG: hypothetical protein LBQ15_02840 [Clostridium sp.]|jgi:hypothetical protein|nr:hypothetical protein [Clostridium sp.]